MTSTGQDIGTGADPYFAGDSLEVTVNVVDENGDPKDLTGVQDSDLDFAIREEQGETAVLDDADAGVTVTVTTAASGEVTITITSGTTSDLDGSYYWSLRVTDAADDTDTVTTGLFSVTER